MNRKTCTVKIGGDWACFSRPEFKTERVSYPVITPSAARGALEAIFWKPEVRWEVNRIDILNPIKEASILRNELGSKQSPKSANGLIVEEVRQQRTSRILKDVSYVIHADLVLNPHATDPLAKYLDIFERRVERGQCYQTPYLGNREFAARFEPAGAEDKPRADVNLGIGTMLFDLAFIQDEDRKNLAFHSHGPAGATVVKGYTRAMFFDAWVKAGILVVPEDLHRKKLELEGKPC